MTQMGRTRIALDGWIGAPGVNTLHWCAPGHADIDQEDVDNFHETLSEAMAELGERLASGITWEIEPTASVHEVDTGTLIGAFTQGDATYTGTGYGSAAASSRATMLVCSFLTGDIIAGRRLRGRMFLGPAAAGCFGADGQVTAAVRSTTPPMFDGIVDPLAARLIVWHRPTPAEPSSGAYGDVTGVSIFSKPGVLRSRRD